MASERRSTSASISPTRQSTLLSTVGQRRDIQADGAGPGPTSAFLCSAAIKCAVIVKPQAHLSVRAAMNGIRRYSHSPLLCPWGETHYAGVCRTFIRH